MTSVVIVGSGFTGFECARKLVRILGKHDAPVDVTMNSTITLPLASQPGARTKGCDSISCSEGGATGAGGVS